MGESSLTEASLVGASFFDGGRDPALVRAVWLERPAGGAWDVIRARGADRVSFLHRLLTADVAGLRPGQGRHALLLTLKGHVVSDLRVLVREDEVWLLVARGQGGATAQALSHYAVMDDFTVDVADELGVLEVVGARAADALRAVGLVLPPSADELLYNHGPAQDVTWVSVRRLGAPAFWLVAGEATCEAWRARLAAAGVPGLPEDVAEAIRVAAGEPKFGVDITADRFPMELGLNDAIDYGKGCYLGQEPIVRVRDRGHVNWRLAKVNFAPDGALVRGDVLTTDARPHAGTLTSAAVLTLAEAASQGVGLALVHASVPDGSDVRVVRGHVSIPVRVRG